MLIIEAANFNITRTGFIDKKKLIISRVMLFQMQV